MPSDDRTLQVVAALAPRMDAFRATVATTGEAVRALLEELGASPEGHRANLAAQFGAFGASYLDEGRVAALLDRDAGMSREILAAIERALGPLDALAKAEPESLAVTLDSGANLREGVASALAHLGRAFAAARLVQAARSGDSRLVRNADRLAGFPYERWNAGERRVAPPLVVELDGVDARASGLTEFLDGQQHIVLVVRGSCSPAPLVRLISPGTFVQQALSVDELTRFLAWTGPGIAALVPESAARFEHDPARGGSTAERLTVSHLPDRTVRGALAGYSAAQQEEERQLLIALSQGPAAPASLAADAAATEPAGDPADKLAAWLLSQADLSAIG